LNETLNFAFTEIEGTEIATKFLGHCGDRTTACRLERRIVPAVDN